MSTLQTEQAVAQMIRGQVVARPISLGVADFRTNPIPLGPGATRVSIDVLDAVGTTWICRLEWTLTTSLDPTKQHDLTAWRPFAPTIEIDAATRTFVLNASVFGVGWISLVVTTPDTTADADVQAVFLVR